MNISFGGIHILPAGEERLEEAARLGEESFGNILMPRELSVEEGSKTNVLVVEPTREDGNDERLAWYEIEIGGAP